MRDSWGNFELSKFNSGKTSGVNGSRILFLCGSSAISGGTNIILNYANALQERGALVSVAFLYDSGKDAGWHPYNKKLRFTSVSEALKDQYDLAIANKIMRFASTPMLQRRIKRYRAIGVFH
jgi:hypothetical protein